MPRPWPKPGAPETPRSVEQIQKSFLQRRRAAVGRNVQTIVGHRLRALGLACIEEVHTGMRKIGGKYLHAKAVSGDFRAVLPPTGRAVLVEVKHRDAETLVPSVIQSNQSGALTANAVAGGMSLVVWARGTDIAIINWIHVSSYFASATPLSWKTAQCLNLTSPFPRPT